MYTYVPTYIYMFISLCVSISICTHSHTPKSTVTHMMNKVPNKRPKTDGVKKKMTREMNLSSTWRMHSRCTSTKGRYGQKELKSPRVKICVPVCCSVLQCVAVCWIVLQCAAVCCNVLQCVAVCCSVLQCVAVCCVVATKLGRKWQVKMCMHL